MSPKPRPAIGVERRGLSLDGVPLPLIAGAVHYWRHSPDVWEPALRSVRSLGFRLVDVYVPWSVHEIDKERFDFGHEDPSKDLAAFLSLAQEQDLYAIVRPGPHINAEMTLFGLPERIVWRRGCQARSPDGAPVLLPTPPLAFPVPSYASKTFFKQASRFFSVVAELLAPLRYPDGPVVLLQSDNEGSLYFRDGIYDQDYHPDAVALYRRYLAKQYGPKANPRQVYGRGGASFHALEPPRRMDANTLEELAYHLDWAAFQEHLVERFIRRTGKRLRKSGLRGVPITHNIAMGDHASVLGQGSVGRVVDVVGLDYYHLASPQSRRTIARRTSELAIRGEADALPSFACELGAGFPPFMAPMQLSDNAFTVMTALAYGLRGYNAYMAVERDRWIGAPIDPQGRPRRSAAFWTSLNRAIEEVDLPALRRRVPVRIVAPRVGIRLRRVLNALSPITPAGFAVMGLPASAHCSDDTFGGDTPLAGQTESFVDAVESALEHEGVPFAMVGDDDPKACVFDAAWVVVPTPAGAVEPKLLETLKAFVQSGGRVTFGPHPPSRTPSLRTLATKPEFSFSVASSNPDEVKDWVHQTIEELALPRVQVEPEGVFATVLEDDGGIMRVVFVIQPEARDEHVSLTLEGAGEAQDLLSGDSFAWREGVLKVPMGSGSVRMLRCLAGVT